MIFWKLGSWREFELSARYVRRFGLGDRFFWVHLFALQTTPVAKGA